MYCCVIKMNSIIVIFTGNVCTSCIISIYFVILSFDGKFYTSRLISIYSIILIFTGKFYTSLFKCMHLFWFWQGNFVLLHYWNIFCCCNSCGKCLYFLHYLNLFRYSEFWGEILYFLSCFNLFHYSDFLGAFYISLFKFIQIFWLLKGYYVLLLYWNIFCCGNSCRKCLYFLHNFNLFRYSEFVRNIIYFLYLYLFYHSDFCGGNFIFTVLFQLWFNRGNYFTYNIEIQYSTVLLFPYFLCSTNLI